VSDAGVVAFGAVSALGEQWDAVSAGDVGSHARLAIERDDELVRAGLRNPFAARVRNLEGDDRATSLLRRAMTRCVDELDVVRPGWRRERVGLIIGTSSGGMRASERAFEALARGVVVAEPENATYFGSVAAVARDLPIPFDPVLVVLGACASSSLAVGLGVRWLERGSCDLVLAGGYDEVTVLVAAGFEGLRATTAVPPPRPFRLGRDGMSLGEGAAVLALARASPRDVARVLGFGAASDAGHLTAPDRSGAGLARAASAALAEAGFPTVDLVSAHGTATPFNDASEARAISWVLGPEAAPSVVVHPFKAQIGHTMGAAGALELLSCVDAIRRGVLPAAAGEGPIDPEAPVQLLERTAAGSPRLALKLSSAFGGSNSALVVGRATPVPSSRMRRPAYVGRAVHVTLALAREALGSALEIPLERVARADELVRLALSAVLALRESRSMFAGAGVVVGTALATIETNALFARRLREHGARAVAPRQFPYTSPNAVAGEISSAFGLTGPSFSVGGGWHAGLEALAAAAVLVEAGDADRMVVVAVDDVGPASEALFGGVLTPGAVASLVTADRAGACVRIGAVSLRRGVDSRAHGQSGHEALVPLTHGSPPSTLQSSSTPDAVASVKLESL
jgi:3-oxoacyl-[acyl-carrier-protein] synthase-1/3-oxoacyl-[acyl-carrier-protein] synthase II